VDHHSQNAPFCGQVSRFNINDSCLVADVGVTGLMLWSMPLASIPLAVGLVAGYLIEEGLLLESFVWVF
jgi:TctA family transporter